MRRAACAAGLLAASAVRAFAAAAGQGSMPDVLIQAEEKRPLAREKPPLMMRIKEDAPLEGFLRTQEETQNKIPSEISKATVYAPEASNSPQVPAASSDWIATPWRGIPVRTFYPLRELLQSYPEASSKSDRSKARWDLVVVDVSGKVFRRFGAAGLPPDKLDFDGRSEEGAWIKAGQVYTAVLTYQDSEGRSHTAMAKPFALPGLSLREPIGTMISLAPRLLFPKESPSLRLSDGGKQLLAEAAWLIQRHFPGFGIQVAAHVSGKDAAEAQAAAQAVARDLAKRLLLPENAVSAKGYPGTPDLEERLDVTVLSR